MGRYTTGAWTTNEGKEISLAYLQKQGMLVKGDLYNGTISWSRNGDPLGIIGIICDYRNPDNVCIVLYYTLTSDGIATKYDYKIHLIEVPTNFDPSRKRLYFVCPESGRNCLKLYKAYGYPKWKSRAAYQNRLYYPLQIASKLWRANSQYWALDAKLEEDRKQRRAYDYAGKPTKRYKKVRNLEFKQRIADYKRFQPESMTIGLQRMLQNST